MRRKDFCFTNVTDFHRAFASEKDCIKFLEKKRWPKGVISPYDPKAKVYKRGDGQYRCGTTGKNFNVRVGTIFHGTKVPLYSWFWAIYLLTSRKKGLSSVQLAKDISVSQKTSWTMLQKIRSCFAPDGTMMNGEIELDETFVGGKNEYRHMDKKMGISRGRSHKDKVAVLGMLQRGGDVVCKVTGNTKASSLTPHIKENIDKDATLYMDEWQGYNQVKKEYKHKVVDHGKNQYVDGDATTNRIEGFWSNCKRSLTGNYNSVEGCHMERYFDEFAFRYNKRNVSDRERFYMFFDNIEHQETYNDIKNEHKERNRGKLAPIAARQQAEKKERKAKAAEAKAKKQAKQRQYAANYKAKQAAKQQAALKAAYNQGLQAGQIQSAKAQATQLELFADI